MQEAANYVCRNHNLKLRDRELRICHAKSNPQLTPTPSKRKNPFPGNSGTPPSKKLAPGEKSSESRYKVMNSKGNISYQGLRASKSGEKKKTPSRPVGGFKSKTKSSEKVKQRTEKRPAVAARKAKARGQALKAGGVPNHAGHKRKMDSRTPQNSTKRKKPRN